MVLYIQWPQEFMRKAPEIDENVSEALYSEEVELLEERGEWVRIRTKIDGYEGWVRQRAIARYEKEFFEGEIARVCRVKVHIYSAPSIRGGLLFSLPFGSRLKVIEKSDERWFKIALLGGGNGFVQSGDVSCEEKVLSKGEMVELSKRFLHLPYTWGGRSSIHGFDCSGFVQMLYREMGVYLPRDSKDQAAWEGLASVAIEEMEPGDLIFFGRDAESISHVGIFLGEERFINATVRESKPYLRISDLSDREWNGSGELRFRTALRVVV